MIKFVEVKKIKRESDTERFDGIYYSFNLKDYFKLNGDYAFSQGKHEVYDGDIGEVIFNFNDFENLNRDDIIKEWYRFISKKVMIYKWDNKLGSIYKFIFNNLDGVSDFDKLVNILNKHKSDRDFVISKVESVPVIKTNQKVNLEQILLQEYKMIEIEIQGSAEDGMIMNNSYDNSVLGEICYALDYYIHDMMATPSSLEEYLRKQKNDYYMYPELLSIIRHSTRFVLSMESIEDAIYVLINK